MNKIAKKLFSAAVIVCLSISSVAAYAAQITPSSTSITLGKNDKEISFELVLHIAALGFDRRNGGVGDHGQVVAEHGASDHRPGADRQG